MIAVSENILSYLNSLWGIERTQKYLDYIEQNHSVYIKLNYFKTDIIKLQDSLSRYNINLEHYPSITNAYKVTTGEELAGKTFEHLLGHYYIQSISSMIPPLVLNPDGNDIVLDLCAAPGSKSTSLSMLMQNKGTLIVNESNINRVKMLVHNIDRMNLINSGVLNMRGELLHKYYQDRFDKILVDVPCSALGVMQKKGEVSKWWNTDRVEQLVILQHKLLVAAIKMLKPGGELVYSTCTLTVEENEAIIDKVLKKHPVEVVPFSLPLSAENGITHYNEYSFNPAIINAKRLIPWEIDSEGFFLIKLKKTGESHQIEKVSSPSNKIKLLSYFDKEIKPLLLNLSSHFEIDETSLSQFKYFFKGNDIFFVEKNWNDEHLSLYERIGSRFGTVDRNNLITLHSQAAQVLQKRITKNIITLNTLEEVKKYINGGNLHPEQVCKGQAAVQFKNEIIGTAVFSSGSMKSRFPKARRMQEIIY